VSARREKRFRQLERRVEALENRATQENISRAAREIDKILEVPDAAWEPAPPRRSIWRRLVDAIKGRAEP